MSAMQEAHGQSLGQEDSLEKGMANPSSNLDRGVAKSRTQLSD